MLEDPETVELVAIDTLKPYKTNARTHSPRQIAQLVASFKTFGVVNPILIDFEDRIIAGHGRVLAAQELEYTHIKALRVRFVTDELRRAYILADNRLAEQAGWDEDLLKVELQHLTTSAPDLSVEAIGFTTAEVDLRLDGAPTKKVDAKAGAVPDIAEKAVSQLGDIWNLGPHKLIVGDALDEDVLFKLMGREKAQMIFTDPPYNVKIDGHAGGKGEAQRREFAMASGEMTSEEFTTFLRRALQNLAQFSVDGSIHYVCMDWRHMRELLDAGAVAYDELKNLIIWVKNNGGMGSFYRSQHELIFVFKLGDAKHVNNFGLGENGRYRTNVWHYDGVNTFKRGRENELAMHPTVKPVSMVADAIRDVSALGDIVLDAFGGSGSTLIAAHYTKRRARLVEIDPLYADVIIKRFQDFSGEPALHGATGETFDATAAANDGE